MPIRTVVPGLILALTFCVAGCSRNRWTPPRPLKKFSRLPDYGSTAGRLLRAHNRQRAARGLNPLRLSTRLNAAAQAHADHMAEVGRMAHEGLGDGDPWSRLRGVSYDFLRAGENVAWNQPDVAAAVRDWMDSPDHRANVLGRYDEMGGAVAYGPGNAPYWCVTFGARLP